MIIPETLLLLVIAYQDFKERAISLWVFIVLFLLKSVFYVFKLTTFDEIALAINLCYLGILFLMVFLYFFLRYKKDSINRIKNSIGSGDIVILVYLAFALPSLFFMVFIQLGIVLSLLTHLVIRFFGNQKLIPFAGYLAIIYAVTLIGDKLTEQKLISDQIIIEWMNRL